MIRQVAMHFTSFNQDILLTLALYKDFLNYDSTSRRAFYQFQSRHFTEVEKCTFPSINQAPKSVIVYIPTITQLW